MPAVVADGQRTATASLRVASQGTGGRARSAVLLGDHAARAPRGMERSGLEEIVRAERHSDAIMGRVAGYLFTDDPETQMINRAA
jgi:hypothetical protein